MKTLSRIVRRFMFLWLLVPAFLLVIVFSTLWFLEKSDSLKRIQRSLTLSTAEHVIAYLAYCDQEISEANDLFKDDMKMLNALTGRSYFLSSYILDNNGKSIKSVPESNLNKDFSGLLNLIDKEYKFLLTVPYYSNELDAVVVGMVKSIPGGKSIFTELNLDSIYDSISMLIVHAESGTAYLTDQYGNMLVNPNKEFVDMQVNIGNSEIYNDLENGKTVSGFYIDEDGFKIKSGVNLESLGWKLFLEQKFKTLFNPYIERAFFLVFFVIAILVFAIIIFVNKINVTIVYPLKRFSVDIENMKKGNYITDSSNNEKYTAYEMISLKENFTEMQKAIKKREYDLRLADKILNNSDFFIVFKDRDLKFLKVNTKFLELTGHKDSKKIIGKTDAEIFKNKATEKQIEEFIENDLKALNLPPGEILAIEETIEENGENRTFLSKKFPVYSKKKNKLLGVAAISNEITFQRKVEEKLKISQKMESVGRLAGGVAHDFNNMLTVIEGYTETAMDMIDEKDEIHQYLKEVLKASQRSSDLTSQLLAFARKQAVEPKKIDLNNTLEHMMKLLYRLIGEDIEISFNLNDKPVYIEIDPSQIDQIIINLFVNARDAIESIGKIFIETDHLIVDKFWCESRGGGEPGEYSVLKISDTGKGMSDETIRHIFDPFFSTKEMGKGTGLGLSTIYGIVKQNNGFIDVYSEIDKGTTFKVYLPFVKVESADKNHEILTPENLQSMGNETVLVVEDEEVILNLITKNIFRQGYSVYKADNPASALKIAENIDRRIDLLLTDVIMPDMTGRELAEKIGEIYPNIKIIFMSGYTADIITRQGVLEEGIEFIQKPFSIKVLAEKIRKVLDT